MQRWVPSSPLQSSFKADAHNAAMALCFQFTLKPHPQTTAGIENTVSELAQQFSTFSALNLILILPRDFSFSVLPILPF